MTQFQVVAAPDGADQCSRPGNWTVLISIGPGNWPERRKNEQ